MRNKIKTEQTGFFFIIVSLLILYTNGKYFIDILKFDYLVVDKHNYINIARILFYFLGFLLLTITGSLLMCKKKIKFY